MLFFLVHQKDCLFLVITLHHLSLGKLMLYLHGQLTLIQMQCILSKVHFLGDVCIKYHHPFCIFILNKLIVFIYSNNLITVGIYNMLKLLYINSIILSRELFILIYKSNIKYLMVTF